jgi:hypothetical protein
MVIIVELGAQARYEKVRDDLRAKYGPPISETYERIIPTVVIDETKWLFPSTELKCSDGLIKDEHHIEIAYSRRKPTPF